MTKNKTITLTMLMTLTFVLSLVALPTVNAHYPSWEIPTFAHIYAATNPIGVGQTAYIYIFLTPTYDGTNVNNDYRFHNYKLVISAPDGKETTITYETVWDTTSNQFASFVPDQVGTYNLTFVFSGQKINDYPHNPNSDYVNDTYAASNASTTLTVQQDSIDSLPLSPLPTEFWTRPIFGQNSLF